jgi:chemotaxis response regulator CheB
MPKAAAALGAAVEILPLDKIAARLVECVGRLTSVS